MGGAWKGKQEITEWQCKGDARMKGEARLKEGKVRMNEEERLEGLAG